MTIWLDVRRVDGTLRGKESAPKTLGTLFASPSLPLQQVLSASCCFSSLLSFWLPWIYSPFPFFMESCNGRLLQLIECIESTQNEVKKKMIESSALRDARKSPGVTRARKKSRCDHVAVLRGARRDHVLASNRRTAMHRDTAWIASCEAMLDPPQSIIRNSCSERAMLEGARPWPVLMMS